MSDRIKELALEEGMDAKQIQKETGLSQTKVYEELRDFDKLLKASENGYGGINLSIPSQILEEAVQQSEKDLQPPFYIDSYAENGKIVLELYGQRYIDDSSS